MLTPRDVERTAASYGRCKWFHAAVSEVGEEGTRKEIRGD